MSNFVFLKNINKDLYAIATEAEKLFRDEYFEQCCVQTRRFGENICKSMLENLEVSYSTFDDMVNFLKDNSQGTAREKEFIDDLFFLKKAGNTSVHAVKVKQDGELALECLQRSFEVAINYAYKTTSNSSLLKLQYDIELLATGKKSKKTLSERYSELKEKEVRKVSKDKTKSKKTSPIKTVPCKKKEYKVKVNYISFWQMLFGAFWLSVGVFLIFYLLIFLRNIKN